MGCGISTSHCRRSGVLVHASYAIHRARKWSVVRKGGQPGEGQGCFISSMRNQNSVLFATQCFLTSKPSTALQDQQRTVRSVRSGIKQSANFFPAPDHGRLAAHLQFDELLVSTCVPCAVDPATFGSTLQTSQLWRHELTSRSTSARYDFHVGCDLLTAPPSKYLNNLAEVAQEVEG